MVFKQDTAQALPWFVFIPNYHADSKSGYVIIVRGDGCNNRGSCRSPFVTPTRALQSDSMVCKQTRKRAVQS